MNIQAAWIPAHTGHTQQETIQASKETRKQFLTRDLFSFVINSNKIPSISWSVVVIEQLV